MVGGVGCGGGLGGWWGWAGSDGDTKLHNLTKNAIICTNYCIICKYLTNYAVICANNCIVCSNYCTLCNLNLHSYQFNN